MSTLGARLTLTLALAFVPVGIVAYNQTRALKEEIRARSEDGLLGKTSRVAQREIVTIRTAQGQAQALALALPLIGFDGAGCNVLMNRIGQANPSASLVAFLPADGRMRCSTSGRVQDFSANTHFQKVRNARVPTFVVNRKGTLSHTSVLAVTYPVFDREGIYRGYTALSLPHSGLSGILADEAGGHEADDLTPLQLWSFDRDGNLLTADVDLETAARGIPSAPSLASLVGQKAQVFSTVSVAGNHRTYAVVPVIEGELYLMSSWRAGKDNLVSQFVLQSYLTPLLMLAAGLLTAAFGAERLVVRHVRTLSRSIQAFAHGDRRLEKLDLDQAPVELRDLGEAYLSMTESITRGEAGLEDIAHEREYLLRELHHRVRNNLQLIASIMNIQLRRTTNPEATILLKDLQDRVMSLATIHRSLFQTSGRTDVSTADLLPEIVQKLNSLSAGTTPRPRVTLDIADIPLSPDQMVPLALLLTDAVGSALRRGPAPGEVKVTLARLGETGAVLRVESGPHSDKTQAGDAEMGQRLMAAFARQLGAQLDISVLDGREVVSVRFEVLAQVPADSPGD